MIKLIVQLLASPGKSVFLTACFVTAIAARTGMIDRVINGVGTVAPLQSVTVRPQMNAGGFTRFRAVRKKSL